jgi:hypothetical protein
MIVSCHTLTSNWSPIPTAAWSIPVAAQNRIPRSCAWSFVVAFAMVYSRRQVFAKAASRVAP